MEFAHPKHGNTECSSTISSQKQVIFKKPAQKKKDTFQTLQVFETPPQDPPHTQDHADTLILATILADGAPKKSYPIPWIMLVG